MRVADAVLWSEIGKRVVDAPVGNAVSKQALNGGQPAAYLTHDELLKTRKKVQDEKDAEEAAEKERAAECKRKSEECQMKTAERKSRTQREKVGKAAGVEETVNVGDIDVVENGVSKAGHNIEEDLASILMELESNQLWSWASRTVSVTRLALKILSILCNYPRGTRGTGIRAVHTSYG